MTDEAFTRSRPFADCLNELGRRKRSWATQGEAFLQARRISRINLDGHVRPYHCPRCGRWHIGHAKKVEDPNVSTKGEIIKELATMEAADAIELADRLKRAGTQTNPLTVTTLVWDLQKQQLVTFEERGNAPTHIRLSAKGREIAAKAQPEEATKVPAVAGPTIGDRIEAIMLARGSATTWSPTKLAEELELTQKHASQAVSMALNNKRFARVRPGIWTLKIWKDAQPQYERPVGVDRTSMTSPRAGLVAPGGPILQVKPPIRATQPVTALAQTSRNGSEPHQNEKPAPPPADPLKDLELIRAIVERAEKREQLTEAARMLEAAGEVELALQTLQKVELTPLEDQVVELVRRVRGQGNNAPDPAHAGISG